VLSTVVFVRKSWHPLRRCLALLYLVTVVKCRQHLHSPSLRYSGFMSKSWHPLRQCLALLSLWGSRGIRCASAQHCCLCLSHQVVASAAPVLSTVVFVFLIKSWHPLRRCLALLSLCFFWSLKWWGVLYWVSNICILLVLDILVLWASHGNRCWQYIVFLFFE